MVKNTEGMERSEISRPLKITRSLRFSKGEGQKGKSGVFESLRHRKLEPSHRKYPLPEALEGRREKGKGRSIVQLNC
jgi:hypothetical protein